MTLASDSDGWNKIVNEQLVVELAKDKRLKVSGFVPRNTKEQRDHAESINIKLVDAEDFSGYSAIELLAHPPDSLDIDILLIHSVGPALGRQAQVIKKHKKCKWAQVVHIACEDVQEFLERADKNDRKLQAELCEKADIIITIGPKVAEECKRFLRCSGKHGDVFELTPGIIESPHIRQVYEDTGKFYVLFSGSWKYFKAKGGDIAAQAIKFLNASSYHLIVALRPCERENEEEIKQALQQEGVDHHQFSVRISESHQDWWKWLCEVDLIIKPSRAEGFGMSGLLAISANLPVLISTYSGLGVVLKNMSSGQKHVVESEDPQVWADRIREIKEKGKETCLMEAEELRNEYMTQFSWKEQCDKLVETFSGMVQQGGGEDSDHQETHQALTLQRLSTKVKEIPLSVFSQVCVKLNVKQQLGFNDFRMFAERVGLKRDETDYIDQRFPNPTEEIVNKWTQKGQATVGQLIEWLKDDSFQRMDVAEILEDWVKGRPSQ